MLAASITSVKQKNRIVIIDAGKTDGIKKGDRICFFDTSGKKIACGRTKKVREKKSYVRVSKKSFRKMTIGMSAIPTSKKGTVPNIRFIRLSGLLSQSSFQFQKLGYKRPTDISNETLWESSGSSALTYGFALEGGITFSIPIIFGAGTQQHRIFRSQSDYSNDKSEYIEVVQEATMTSFWADGFYLFWGSPSSMVKLGNGLGFDSTQITISNTHQNDDGTTQPYIDGTATHTSILLRTTVDYTKSIGSVGISIGLTINLPLSSSGTSTSVSYQIPEEKENLGTDHVSSLSLDLADALNSSLNGKSVLGFVSYLGLSYSF